MASSVFEGHRTAPKRWSAPCTVLPCIAISLVALSSLYPHPAGHLIISRGIKETINTVHSVYTCRLYSHPTASKKMDKLPVVLSFPRAPPHNMDYLPTRWPESPRIVMRYAPRAPNARTTSDCGKLLMSRAAEQMATAAKFGGAFAKPQPAGPDSQGESWLTAALPMDDPYCGCKLTLHHSSQLQWL